MDRESDGKEPELASEHSLPTKTDPKSPIEVALFEQKECCPTKSDEVFRPFRRQVSLCS
jgi:hypothetical protein